MSAPEGTLSLSDFLVIPADANELRVYIPLTPEGAHTGTQGMLGIRYPIAHSGYKGARISPDFPHSTDYYPLSAKVSGESGDAIVVACVDENGKLTHDPWLVKSAGHPDLDEGAFELAKAGSGHYEPLQQEGHRIPGCIQFKIQFRN